MIRVYLAAPWADRELMFERAAKFDMTGALEITHRWWFDTVEGGYSAPVEELAVFAQRDFEGAATADVVVVFQTGLSEGKAVEQGIALALGIPIISVGKLREVRNIFHYLPEYTWVDNIEDAIAKCVALGDK